MSRWKAAGFHLLISVCLALAVASIIYFVWYPPPYFLIAGGSALLILIMGVDVVLGPCLTLAIFKSGKKGLHFDLTVIAILQATAFCYGAWVIARARPVFLVGVVDRFVVVAADDLSDEDLAAGSLPEFRTRSWTGPRLVGGVPPKDGAQAMESAMQALAGKDVEKFPKYYVEFAQVAAKLLERSHPLTDTMKKSAAAAAEVAAFVRAHGGAAADYRSLPIQGHVTTFTMIVSAKTGQPLGALPIIPW